MSLQTLLEMVGASVGISLGVAIAVMAAGFLAFRKARNRARWFPAVMAVAVAGGFVAGFGKQFGYPAKWNDEIWKWVAVSAVIAGLLLAIWQALPAKIGWPVLLVLVSAVTWVTVRRISTEQNQRYYAMGLAGGMTVYLAAFWPAMREPRLWATGAWVMVLCAAPAVRLFMPFDMNLGEMFILLTALAGLAGVTGFVPAFRAMASGAAGFLVVVFAVLMTLGVFYDSPEVYPLCVLALFASAPVAAGVAWIPWFRRRPWRCALTAVGAALAVVLPAVMWAIRIAPAINE